MTLSARLLALTVGFAALVVANSILLPSRVSKRALFETVKPAPLRLIVRASGTLEAKASIAMRVPFDAKVVQKSFKEGDKVTAGQRILVVDRERIRLDYQAKKDNFANAQADLAKTRKDLKLQKTLFEKQAVAFSAVDDAKRALIRAEQAVRAAQESFRLETVRWNSNTLVALFAGTIVKDFLGDDTTILANKDLVIIADVSEYTARVNVDELDIKQVIVGQPAEIRIALYPQVVFKAMVAQIGSSSENQGPGAAEIAVVLRLTSTEGMSLRPKLTAEARIFTGQTEPVLSVPREAIDNTEGVPRVWRVALGKRLRPVPVGLGRSNLERIEITDGLKPGWQICEASDPEFEFGMRITEGTPIVRRPGPAVKRAAGPSPKAPKRL